MIVVAPSLAEYEKAKSHLRNEITDGDLSGKIPTIVRLGKYSYYYKMETSMNNLIA